jgi:hypothetical protein
MAFPETPAHTKFNTIGMKAPIDIKKYNEDGHLVKSFESVPPGMTNLDTGPNKGTVIESPARRRNGGYTRAQEGWMMMDPSERDRENPYDLSAWDYTKAGVTGGAIGVGLLRARRNLAQNIRPQFYDNVPERLESAVRHNEPWTPEDPKSPATDHLYSTGQGHVETTSHMRERQDLFHHMMGFDLPYGRDNKGIQPADYKPTQGMKPWDHLATWYKSPWTEQYLIRELQRGNTPESLAAKGVGYHAPKGAANVLGDHAFTLGEDEKGKYIAYYDKWDLSILSTAAGRAGSPDLIKDAAQLADNAAHWSAGVKMPRVYGRIYYDDRGRPIKEEISKLEEEVEENTGGYDGKKTVEEEEEKQMGGPVKSSGPRIQENVPEPKVEKSGDYNYSLAREEGYGPDKEGHWPSFVYNEMSENWGTWLKSKDHPTAKLEFMSTMLNPNYNPKVDPSGYFGNDQLTYQSGGFIGLFPNATSEEIQTLTEIESMVQSGTAGMNTWEALDWFEGVDLSTIKPIRIKYNVSKRQIIDSILDGMPDMGRIEKAAARTVGSMKDFKSRGGYRRAQGGDMKDYESEENPGPTGVKDWRTSEYEEPVFDNRTAGYDRGDASRFYERKQYREMSEEELQKWANRSPYDMGPQAIQSDNTPWLMLINPFKGAGAFNEAFNVAKGTVTAQSEKALASAAATSIGSRLSNSVAANLARRGAGYIDDAIGALKAPFAAAAEQVGNTAAGRAVSSALSRDLGGASVNEGLKAVSRAKALANAPNIPGQIAEGDVMNAAGNIIKLPVSGKITAPLVVMDKIQDTYEGIKGTVDVSASGVKNASKLLPSSDATSSFRTAIGVGQDFGLLNKRKGGYRR